MARWITQTLSVNNDAEIILLVDQVQITQPNEGIGLAATFRPVDRADANAMAISLRLAAKRLEDIGKGLN